MKNYHVYILIKNKEPIYVGCSCSMRTRLSKHKSTKDFDSHLILNSYKSKKEALIAENSIIRFISIFGGEGWLNSKHWDLEIKGAILRNEYYKD